MKYFSTFSGVEGIGLGLPEGWECIGFSEIDKFASQVLKYHYPSVENYGDISTVDWGKVPDFDLLTGGSPCQDFSIAGKRRGLSGAKSSLAWEYIRGLRSKQPKYFLWENVKGVMSSRGGWDFANLLTAFSESGYALWWQVLNAKDFGVPQNRERIFVIGTRDGSPKEVLLERKDDKEIDELQGYTNNLTTRYEALGTGSYVVESEQYAQIRQLNKPKHSNDRLYGTGGIAPSLNTMQGGNRQPFIAVALRNKDRSKHQGKEGQKYGDYAKNYHLEPQRDGVAFAVKETAHENYVLGDSKIRKLTPKECERLMSWPDDWTRYGSEGEISDSQRYKMCGNGVVSAVVRELVKHHLFE